VFCIPVCGPGSPYTNRRIFPATRFYGFNFGTLIPVPNFAAFAARYHTDAANGSIVAKIPLFA
jgi:hypothetical protein